MARESELSVNVSGFEKEMEQQRERARQAHKSIDILVSEESNDADATEFSGFEMNNLKNFSTRCIDVIEQGDSQYLVFEKTPFYAEMGGQVGDSGSVFIGDQTIPIVNTLKDKVGRFLHQLIFLGRMPF
jgi:alanyl-tRNA synthetase